MAPRIRIIGSLNIDYTTITPRFPGPGETVAAESLTVSAGGKGANQAVACGRASHTSHGQHDVQVEMVGAVGIMDPQFGVLMKPVLEESRVDSKGVTEIEGTQTGTATIVVDKANAGENRILVVPGANYEGMNDADQVVKRALRLPLPDVFVLQGEIPQDTTFALLKAIPEAAEEARKMVELVFNPAPVYPEGIPVGRLKHVTHLVVNETEMAHLAVDAGDKYDAAETEEEKRAALTFAGDIFHRRSVRTVVITRGAQGVFCSTPDGSFHLAAAQVAEVADTTAAGDTFVGYYAVELARQLGKRTDTATERILRQACRRATLAAAKCVAREGAIKSIPWGYEI